MKFAESRSFLRMLLPLTSQGVAALLFLISPLCPAALEDPQSVAKTVVSGIVLDPSGAFIVGAEVTLTSPSKKAIAATTTDHNGEFKFENLPAGKCQLQVHANGFRDATV